MILLSVAWHCNSNLLQLPPAETLPLILGGARAAHCIRSFPSLLLAVAELDVAITHRGRGNQRGVLGGWAREGTCKCHSSSSIPWSSCCSGARYWQKSPLFWPWQGGDPVWNHFPHQVSSEAISLGSDHHMPPAELFGRAHGSGSGRAVCLFSSLYLLRFETS